MSRGFISVGTGAASSVGAVLFCMNGGLGEIPAVVTITTLTAGILGLAAAKACKNEGEALDRKDCILIGGASLLGSVAGVATSIAIATLIAGVTVGSMYGSFFGSFMGNMLSGPRFSLFGPTSFYYRKF